MLLRVHTKTLNHSSELIWVLIYYTFPKILATLYQLVILKWTSEQWLVILVTNVRIYEFTCLAGKELLIEIYKSKTLVLVRELPLVLTNQSVFQDLGQILLLTLLNYARVSKVGIS